MLLFSSSGKLSHPNLSIPEYKWKIEKKLPESLSIPILCYSPTHLVCYRVTNLHFLQILELFYLLQDICMFPPILTHDWHFLILQVSDYMLPSSLITKCKFISLSPFSAVCPFSYLFCIFSLLSFKFHKVITHVCVQYPFLTIMIMHRYFKCILIRTINYTKGWY